jgi:uncharacterized protein YkwD
MFRDYLRPRVHAARARTSLLQSATALIALSAVLTPAAALAATPHHHHRKRHRTRRHHPRVTHRTRAAGASASCSGADTPARDASTAQTRAAVLCLVNRERERHGLPALTERARLDRSAQGWADTMARTGRFSHTGYNSDPGSRMRGTGYVWQAEGENIALGYETPRQVVDAWMASAHHCENMLDPKFRDIGGGVPSPGRRRATWTLDFGLKAHARAASSNWRPADSCPYGG